MMEQVLYQLPDDWKWQSFDKLFSTKGFSVGKVKSSEVIETGIIPVVDQSQNFISGYSDKIELSYVGELPVLIYGDHTNCVKYVDFEFICGADGTKVMNINADLEPKFAFYLISKFKPDTQGYRRHFSILKKINFPIPPKCKQKNIVEKLDAMFSRIDTAIAHLQESITLVDALYASTINEQMKLAIEQVGLSKVEEHIDQIQTGTTPPTKQSEFYDSGDISWFTPSDFGDHDVLTDSNRKLSYKAFDAGKARKFEAGTVLLVAIGATIGKIGYLEHDASSNQQITGMKFSDKILPRYAYYWFRFIKSEIIANASTATLPIINQKGIKALSFCAPTKKLQEHICNKIDEVSLLRKEIRTELNEKVDLMRLLKASVLDSAFKGEL
ncbi:restriction endonuclease subunit S [Aeromonas veronii]|uniref:restriction endonuclease subunit S n=1 Tax=Aeromonas veronii TaxID=654 RepID=UPI0007B591C2|nr:hypothetical protein A6033_00945 [Aeromonas veronii]